MKISIIIPTYNSSKTIYKTINHCLAQDYFKKEKVDIAIVDDGSRDRTKDIVTEYPVRYIYQKNAGPAKARNNGWKQTTADIICFTDSDCIPEKDWVSKLISNYTSDDIVGVGGSYDIVNKDNLLAECIHQEIIYRHSKIPGDVNYLGSFNVSYRRRVLEEVGGFDESFKRASGEDNDLAYRIKKKGYRLIFDRNITVAHHYPESLKKYLKQQFWHGFWRVKLYKKHPEMKQGDHYAGIFDFIQPPLAMLTLFLLPFSFITHINFLVLFLFLTGILLQLPITLAIVKETKKLKYIFLGIVTFLRGYARGLGLLSGMINFYILSKDEK